MRAETPSSLLRPGSETPTRVAKFVTGSTMRHVVVMTLTGALGLMAMFFVDLIDLFFLSLLKRTEVTAAIGFAGTLAFVNLALSLGTGIAAAALVARNLGAGRVEAARHYATNSAVFALGVSFLIALAVALEADGLLRLLGARGEALELAKLYVRILCPGFALLGAGVTFAFILRGLGDARRAMYITLVIAIITAVLDPILIFGLDLDIRGAAIATLSGYAGAFAVGYVSVTRAHHFLAPFSMARFNKDLPAILALAGPAMLTQLATPFANAYMTAATAPFGDDAVAAIAIISRLVPVAFGIIFALSGSVGPIIGQNIGAGQFDRVRQTLWDALKFNAIYTMTTCILLFVLREQVALAFSAEGETKHLVLFFCTFISWTWAFAGAQFVANAVFNNTSRATYSTLTNWAKATIGTIPLAIWGAALWGPRGILLGIGIGSVIFGILSALWAFAVVNRLNRQPEAS
jgi:putative MATE family efflux protein